MVLDASAARPKSGSKAHSCDRHHIASAMAELVCCLSIIPHMRSFDVPPKLSPAHAGLFCAARLKGGHAIGAHGERREKRATPAAGRTR
jgi:hypothetical protein